MHLQAFLPVAALLLAPNALALPTTGGAASTSTVPNPSQWTFNWAMDQVTGTIAKLAPTLNKADGGPAGQTGNTKSLIDQAAAGLPVGVHLDLGDDEALDVSLGNRNKTSVKGKAGSSNCFPALGFDMPANPPDLLDGWWCDIQDEYAFMGFSYDLSACQGKKTLSSDFKRMRNEYNARYVRLYSNCDKDGYNDDLINAAWENGLGLHMLIWFGFDGTDEWKGRKTALINSIKSNSKAPYVVRAVVVGSEPLYDWVLDADQLAAQVTNVRKQLEPWTGKGGTGMQVTISEMPYGFQTHGDAPAIFKAVDIIEGNILPYFDQKATTGAQAWPFVQAQYDYFVKHGLGKKILFTQTGWPSNADVWKPNSPNAVADIANEQAYFDLLNWNCDFMKTAVSGGVGWFAQIYSDGMLPGWGVLDYNLNPKFPFSPDTKC